MLGISEENEQHKKKERRSFIVRLNSYLHKT